MKKIIDTVSEFITKGLDNAIERHPILDWVALSVTILVIGLVLFPIVIYGWVRK